MTGANYTTDRKEEFLDYTDKDKLVTVYRIYATSTGGAKFHVDVAESKLGEADKLLSERARILDEI